MSKDSRDHDPSWPKPSVTRPSPQQEHQWDKENKYSETQICLSRWLNGITIVSAILAGGALFFLWTQVNMIKTSLQTSERAWITVKGVTLEKGNVAGEETPVLAGVYNSGYSPALHMTIRHIVTIASKSQFEAKATIPNVPAHLSVSVIGPNSTMTSRVQHLITGEDMNNLTAEKAHFYSFGIIEYRDVFDTEHWTTFCFWSPSPSILNLVACASGNDMDKN